MRSGLTSIWHLARCEARPPVAQLCGLEGVDGWRVAKQVLEDERQVVVSVACRRGFGGGVGSPRMTHSEKKLMGYAHRRRVCSKEIEDVVQKDAHPLRGC